MLGVTAAATLRFVTVIGLCFGDGQISLRVAAFVLGMLVLSGLRWFDCRMKQEQHGTLILPIARDHPPEPEEEIQATVKTQGTRSPARQLPMPSQTEERQIKFNLQWRAISQSADTAAIPSIVAEGPARDGRSVEDYVTQLPC